MTEGRPEEHADDSELELNEAEDRDRHGHHDGSQCRYQVLAPLEACLENRLAYVKGKKRRNPCRDEDDKRSTASRLLVQEQLTQPATEQCHSQKRQNAHRC